VGARLGTRPAAVDRTPAALHGKDPSTRGRLRSADSARGQLSMLPLVLALTLGAGVYLLFDGLTRPAQTRTASRPRLSRIRALLVEAGLHDVSANTFVLFSLASGLLAAVLMQFVLGWGLVSVLSGFLGLIVPSIYVSQRAERRRAVVQGGLVD